MTDHTTSTPMPQRPRKWWSLLLYITLFFAVTQVVSWWQSRDAKTGPAPEFSLPLALPANGQSVLTLSDWRRQHSGRPVVVYFWAQWCPICKVQAGAINSLMGDHPVLTVAMQSGTAEQVRQHLLREERPWLTAVDNSGEVSARYGVSGVPTTVVLDAKGAIDSVTVGYSPNWMLRWRLWRAL